MENQTPQQKTVQIQTCCLPTRNDETLSSADNTEDERYTILANLAESQRRLCEIFASLVKEEEDEETEEECESGQESGSEEDEEESKQ
jgi:hypothetical protein